MSGKRFYVKLDLELHAITCPGVWLCAHGCLEATIETLGYFLRTGPLEPRFPLLCHEHFSMEGYFKSATSLEQLKVALINEPLNISLWQNNNLLAYYKGTLNNILTQEAPRLSKTTICNHNLNAQLQMKATSAFPGILSPNLELSANIFIKDRLSRGGTGCSTKLTQLLMTNKPLETNAVKKGNLRKRQRPVCHARSSESSMCSNSSSGSSLYALANENSYNEGSDKSCACCESDVTSYKSDNNNSYATEHQKSCSICQTYKNMFF